MDKILAPIVLFVYNRPEHTRRTLEALAKNKLSEQSNLFIYADGPKEQATPDDIENIEQTRNIVKDYKCCKNVIIKEFEFNKGLAKSIIEGVTEIIEQYGRAIVLEDDIITSPGFLLYMNNALRIYENEEQVMHVSGYLPFTSGADKLPSTFFLRYMSCWGWATWKRAWDHLIIDGNYLYKTLIKRNDFAAFDLDGRSEMFLHLEKNLTGEMNTWAVKWYSSIFLHNGLCLHPCKSLVKQIGFDGSGTHCNTEIAHVFDVELVDEISIGKIKIEESKIGKSYIRRFYKFGQDSSYKVRFKVFKNSLVNPILRRIKGY